MSFSLHSSTEYLGSPNSCAPNSTARLPVKSSIGRDVLEGLAEPLIEEPLETVPLKSDKIRYVEDLRDLGERAALALTSRDERGSGFAAHQAIPP